MSSAASARGSLFSGSAVPKMWNLPASRSWFGDLVVLVFLVAQCMDGVLTYVGVVSFGLGAEANPIVAGLMAAVGHGTGLLAAKGVAIALGIGLHLRQLHVAVALLAGFYVVAAVLPWVAILFT
jgi:hypothetical protein